MAVPLITGTTLDSLGQRSLDWGKLDAEMNKARADTELKRIAMMQQAMADAAGAAAAGNAVNSNERIEMGKAQNDYDLGMAPYMSTTGGQRVWGDVMDRDSQRRQDGFGGIGGGGGGGGMAAIIAAILEAIGKGKKNPNAPGAQVVPPTVVSPDGY